MKNWPCSLWIKILVNVVIFFWVWPDFCDRNCSKLVIGNLSWLKQTLQFCRKLIHVSGKVTFAILGISWYKNWSDLSFPQIFCQVMVYLRSARYILSLCEKLTLQLMGWDLCHFGYLLPGLTSLLSRKYS